MTMTISGVKPYACSFKGTEKASEEGKAPSRDPSEMLDNFAREAEEVAEAGKRVTDATTNVMKTVTDSMGTLGTTAVGCVTICSKPFNKVYEFFTDVVMENGKPKVVELFDKSGKPKMTDSGEILTKVVRKLNLKKVGIAGAIVAAVVGLALLFKKMDNDKHEKLEAAKLAQNTPQSDE